MTLGKSSAASLRIASTSIGCDEISNSIGIKPTKAYEKGEVLGAKSAPDKTRQESLWIYNFEREESIPLEDILLELVDILKGESLNLQRIREKCDVEIFCRYASDNGQGGFVLNHNLLHKLSELQIDVVFDLYLTDV